MFCKLGLIIYWKRLNDPLYFPPQDLVSFSKNASLNQYLHYNVILFMCSFEVSEYLRSYISIIAKFWIPSCWEVSRRKI